MVAVGIGRVSKRRVGHFRIDGSKMANGTREILKTDLLGYPIEPGCLIAFAKSGLSRNLTIRIVSSVTKVRINCFGSKNLYSKRECGFKKVISKTAKWTGAEKTLQKHILVIKDPLYHLNNNSIVKQLGLIDSLKDLGFVPKDYELGMPFSYDRSGVPIKKPPIDEMF